MGGGAVSGEDLHNFPGLAQSSAKLFLKAPVFSLTDVKLQRPQRSKDILHTRAHAPAVNSLDFFFFLSGIHSVVKQSEWSCGIKPSRVAVGRSGLPQQGAFRVPISANWEHRTPMTDRSLTGGETRTSRTQPARVKGS